MGFAGLEPIGVPPELIRTLLLSDWLAMLCSGLSFFASIRVGALFSGNQGLLAASVCRNALRWQDERIKSSKF